MPWQVATLVKEWAW